MLGVVGGEEVTRKVRVTLTRLLCRLLGPQFPIPNHENVSFPPGTGKVPVTWGRQVRGQGQSTFLFQPYSQIPSAGGTHYSQAPYFGVPRPEL